MSLWFHMCPIHRTCTLKITLFLSGVSWEQCMKISNKYNLKSHILSLQRSIINTFSELLFLLFLTILIVLAHTQMFHVEVFTLCCVTSSWSQQRTGGNQFPFFSQDRFVILIAMHNSMYSVTKKRCWVQFYMVALITVIKEENLNFKKIYNVFNSFWHWMVT